MSLAKGSLRVRVKSSAERLASGVIFLGIRLKKLAKMGVIWHGFSQQVLCHHARLLFEFFTLFEVLLLSLTRRSIAHLVSNYNEKLSISASCEMHPHV
ncbi:MAG: hypothetical protein WHS86_16335, partial [Desulfosoma sp.]